MNFNSVLDSFKTSKVILFLDTVRNPSSEILTTFDLGEFVFIKSSLNFDLKNVANIKNKKIILNLNDLVLTNNTQILVKDLLEYGTHTEKLILIFHKDLLLRKTETDILAENLLKEICNCWLDLDYHFEKTVNYNVNTNTEEEVENEKNTCYFFQKQHNGKIQKHVFEKSFKIIGNKFEFCLLEPKKKLLEEKLIAERKKKEKKKPLPTSSFNLNTSEREKEQKEKAELPYMKIIQESENQILKESFYSDDEDDASSSEEDDDDFDDPDADLEF